MSPAKLLGLPRTEDSIIVRAGAYSSVRVLPQILAHHRTSTRAGDTSRSREVLRSLIAVRKIGEKK